jgi:hypothetical protein
MARVRQALATVQPPNSTGGVVNEYEAERARIIARNNEKLQELGVKQAASALQGMYQKPVIYKPYKKRPRAQVG